MLVWGTIRREPLARLRVHLQFGFSSFARRDSVFFPGCVRVSSGTGRDVISWEGHSEQPGHGIRL